MATRSKRTSTSTATVVVLAIAAATVALVRKRRLDAARQVFYERFGEP